MTAELYIGVMSGTSVDGVDAVVADFAVPPCRTLAHVHVGFDGDLRAELTQLQRKGADELHRAALAANALMDCCHAAVSALLLSAGVDAEQIAAVGLHGQTVRHRPDLGYTTQLANPARLAEATGMTVVADFRSRDVAAGGQGAPLVPAFHAALFALPDRHRVVVNIGGIANVTDLPATGLVRGFDTGPGNTLLDAWCERHTKQRFDRDGAWAAHGKVIDTLLSALQREPYFALAPPKSTGRDRFHLRWLERHLRPSFAPVDVQRTLVALTAQTVAAAIAEHCAAATEVLVCGGGAHNATLMRDLAGAVHPRAVSTTASVGVAVDQVEALAFAWLARETLATRPGNLPAVTGARGSRVLGAIYRA
ncbi:MAG TPA: anhydro-N-acetylmuramic acid kinase [Casimicrobiaceae bacterium]|nr:anhydro-N-acetylmuramic acid kinase [Casimicrobiaceae bacterium]